MLLAQHDGRELLDAGRGLEAYGEHGKTMGIPLLYPWANRLAEFGYSVAGKDVSLPGDPARIPTDPNGLPIHGVLPSLLSFEADAHDGAGTIDAHIRWDTPELLELFPFGHELTIEVRLGEGELALSTIVCPTGEDRVPVSFGFHPYLRLPDSSRATWQLQLPPADHLSLDDRMIPTGQRHPAPDGDLALGRQHLGRRLRRPRQPARYAARTDDQGIALELIEGFPYSQIYAPPRKDFICFEPMTAPTNALRSGDGLSVIDPGEEHRAGFRLVHWTQ